MDVAKYIGLFLLKNEQCYIHGLGTLQMVRKPASYDGQSLHASAYEILMVPGGNVDEALANFIANNEQISISKASNALKEYSAKTRGALQQGEEVSLPYLGKFREQDGRVGFVTTPQLIYKPAPIRAQKGTTATQQQQQPRSDRPAIPHQPFVPAAGAAAAQNRPTMAAPEPEHYQEEEFEENSGGGIKWGRLILLLLILGILAAGTYFGYTRYVAPRLAKPAPTNTPPSNFETQIPEVADFEEEPVNTTNEEDENTGTDTEEGSNAQQTEEDTPAEKDIETAPETTGPPPKMTKIRALINTYDTRARAEKRQRQLQAYGTSAQLIAEDSNTFYIVLKVETTTQDKGKILDSLTALYNPLGVTLY